jgi:hypothetical protein
LSGLTSGVKANVESNAKVLLQALADYRVKRPPDTCCAFCGSDMTYKGIFHDEDPEHKEDCPVVQARRLVNT